MGECKARASQMQHDQGKQDRGIRDRFYKTQKWRNVQAAYKKAAGGLCERCLKCGMIRPGKFVHHKIHLTDENVYFPEIALDFENLELLCVDCHAAEHSRRRYIVDADGFAHTKASGPARG